MVVPYLGDVDGGLRGDGGAAAGVDLLGGRARQEGQGGTQAKHSGEKERKIKRKKEREGWREGGLGGTEREKKMRKRECVCVCVSVK